MKGRYLAMASNGNRSAMNTTVEDYHEDIRVNVGVVLPLYLAVLAICLVGNGLVCFTVMKNQEMRRKRWYLFLVNLSIADIAFTLTTPMHLIQAAGVDLGDAGCKISLHTINITMLVSILTLAYISIHRYLNICQPKVTRVKRINQLWIVVFLWVYAGIFLLPTPIYCRKRVNGNNSCDCRSGFPSKTRYRIYQFVLIIFGFYIPFLVMLFCYTMITIRLLGNRGDRSGIENDQSGKKKRSIKMMMLATFLTFICWFPYTVLYLLKEMKMGDPKLIGKCLLFIQLLTFTNSAWNPFTYCIFSKDFRKGFKKIFFWRKSNDVFQTQNKGTDGKTQQTNLNMTTTFRGARIKESRVGVFSQQQLKNDD